MISRRKFFVRAASVATTLGVGVIGARPGMAAEAEWYAGQDGYAADGADVVAYFSLDADARGVAGDDAYATEWNGARWRFSSADTLAAFEAEPERYAPQYGGYCAWAVAQGYTAHGDINAWHIVNDRLYLNYSRRIRTRWRKDIPGFIAQADANWPDLLTA
ncbi:MAG: YHS domain-containing (seleno)protein [Pseudomonadota bacterium]